MAPSEEQSIEGTPSQNNDVEEIQNTSPIVSKMPDKINENIQQAILGAASPGGKCGDDWRMKMSLLEVNQRVFEHAKVGPLKLGLPIGTWRPDDEGVDTDGGAENRLYYRRLVMMVFRPGTGNRALRLLPLNVHGEKAKKSASKKALNISPPKAMLIAKNVDFFEEFQGFNFLLDRGGPLLCAKKTELLFHFMTRWWKVGFATNWPTADIVLTEPGQSKARTERIQRILGDTYRIPYFQDRSMNAINPANHRYQLYVRMDLAEFKDLSKLSDMSSEVDSATYTVSPELLQERFALFLRLCDRVTNVRDQIVAEFGNEQFSLKEKRIEHKENPGDLGDKRPISRRLLEAPKEGPNMGKFFMPFQGLGEENTQYFGFITEKKLEQLQIIDPREGQTVRLTKEEQQRWDAAAAGNETTPQGKIAQTPISISCGDHSSRPSVDEESPSLEQIKFPQSAQSSQPHPVFDLSNYTQQRSTQQQPVSQPISAPHQIVDCPISDLPTTDPFWSGQTQRSPTTPLEGPLDVGESHEAHEELKISTIQDPYLPPDRSWIDSQYHIGIFEYSWLVDHGVTEGFVSARLDPERVGQAVLTKHIAKIVHDSNTCHTILEGYHRAMEKFNERKLNTGNRKPDSDSGGSSDGAASCPSNTVLPHGESSFHVSITAMSPEENQRLINFDGKARQAIPPHIPKENSPVSHPTCTSRGRKLSRARGHSSETRDSGSSSKTTTI